MKSAGVGGLHDSSFLKARYPEVRFPKVTKYAGPLVSLMLRVRDPQPKNASVEYVGVHYIMPF